MTPLTLLSDYPFKHCFTPRWRDNDQYGHINNVVYYEYFDSTANLFLIEQAGLDPVNSPQIAYVVHSQCQYIAPLSFPNLVEVGLAVKQVGNSSLTWQLGIFAQSDPQIKAVGEFVHVFVDRASGQKTAIPNTIRQKASQLLIQEDKLQ